MTKRLVFATVLCFSSFAPITTIADQSTPMKASGQVLGPLTPPSARVTSQARPAPLVQSVLIDLTDMSGDIEGLARSIFCQTPNNLKSADSSLSVRTPLTSPSVRQNSELDLPSTPRLVFDNDGLPSTPQKQISRGTPACPPAPRGTR